MKRKTNTILKIIKIIELFGKDVTLVITKFFQLANKTTENNEKKVLPRQVKVLAKTENKNKNKICY